MGESCRKERESIKDALPGRPSLGRQAFHPEAELREPGGQHLRAVGPGEAFPFGFHPLWSEVRLAGC